MRFRRSLAAVLFVMTVAACIPGSASAYTKTDWLTIPSIPVKPSVNPIILEELERTGIDRRAKVNKTKIKITVPDGPGPFPAVLIFHGCTVSDPYSEADNWWDWRDHFVEQGFVAVVVDSFTARNLASICDGSQPINLTIPIFSARIGDAYAALDYLVKNREIYKVDPGNIFALGGSHGGGLTIALLIRHTLRMMRSKLAHGYAFAGGMSLYPACYGNRPEFYNPITVSAGERDDWTPPDNCISWRDTAAPEGSAAYELHIMPGATHSFDYRCTNSNGECNAYGYTIRYDPRAVRNTKQIFNAFTAKNSQGHGQIADEPGYASADDLKQALSGNTVTFEALHQKMELLFSFGGDGTFTVRNKQVPARVINSGWQTNEFGQLCINGAGPMPGGCMYIVLEDRKLAFFSDEGQKIGAGEFIPGGQFSNGRRPQMPRHPQPLNEAEIREALTGNTVYFISPGNAQKTFLYFSDDGTALLKSLAAPKKARRLSWFINEKGALCRKLPNGNTPCGMVLKVPGEDALFFVLQGRPVGVRVLSGKQLTPKAMKQAPEEFPQPAMIARGGPKGGQGAAGPGGGPGMRPGGPGGGAGMRPGGPGGENSPPDPDTVLRMMDQNNDGKLSADEFRGPAPVFEKLDTDKDGYVTKEEMLATRNGTAAGSSKSDQFAANVVKAFDRDGDGKLSEDELEAAGEQGKRLKTLDLDGDGTVTSEEITGSLRKKFREHM